ncbi:MAG TPA: hypothetical protein VNC22_08405 [Sporichthya sp.]|nr:hypothetical protein [Sporichthya sp.]
MADVEAGSRTVEFLVTVPEDGVVAVKWSKPLGRPKSHAYQELANLLEELDGVEWLDVGRYSAHLGLADHVTRLGPLAREVHEALSDALLPGRPLCQAIKFAVIDPEFTVTLAALPAGAD